MVFQLNAQIPLTYRGYNYGQSQQNALRGLQMQAAERDIDEQNALATALRGSSDALTSDDPTIRGQAAAALARTGTRGYQLAAPVLEVARQEREFNAIRGRFGGGAAFPSAPDLAMPSPMAPASPVGPVAPGPQTGGPTDIRARNAEAAQMREAVLSDPNLTPEQQAEALARISAWLAAPSAPERPGGYRSPSGVENVYAGAAPPTGVIPATMPGGGGGQAPQGVIPAQAGGGGPPRQPGMPTPQQFAQLAELSGHPNPRIARWAQAQVQTWAPFMRQNDPERFVETTRNIGGRPVLGQQNQRTGQFTPYPGQGGGADGITPAQARSDVLQLGPRVASGEIQPGTPEYDRYEMAYRLATQGRTEWVEDPNRPGYMQQIRVPGIQLNPGRFPPPVEGVYGAGGASTAPQAGAAPSAPPAVAGAAPAAPPGAPAPDATSANPTPITRQSPNSQPTGEENLSAGYGRRMVEAEALMERATRSGFQPGNIRDGVATAITTGERAGPVSRFVGNTLMSGQGQLYRQAQEDWVRAKLRRESGAVIGDDEMAREILVYFPQPGDTPATIAQKAQSRRVAIDAMRQAAGRASATVPQIGSAGQPVRVSTPDEARRLPSGTRIILPDGTEGRVP